MMIWDRADAISDKIVDLINEERHKTDFSPTQTLAGLMLGMCAFASTCPKSLAPRPYIDVMDSIRRCLNSMMNEEFEGKIYTIDERRVCEFLQKLAPDIGCGDDPVGFLIASYETLLAQRKGAMQ